MAELSFEITNKLIVLVLSRPVAVARLELHQTLVELESNEGQFYDSIAHHSSRLRLTTDQWFELLSRLPNRIFRSNLIMRSLISDEQIKLLPPVTG